jgi:hypothetical protein
MAAMEVAGEDSQLDAHKDEQVVFQVPDYNPPHSTDSSSNRVNDPESSNLSESELRLRRKSALPKKQHIQDVDMSRKEDEGGKYLGRGSV